MTALLTIRGTTHSLPFNYVADGKRATFYLRLNAAEIVQLELTPAELRGVADMVEIVKRDGEMAGAGVRQEVVRSGRRG